jgi:hypothetical protein
MLTSADNIARIICFQHVIGCTHRALLCGSLHTCVMYERLDAFILKAIACVVLAIAVFRRSTITHHHHHQCTRAFMTRGEMMVTMQSYAHRRTMMMAHRVQSFCLYIKSRAVRLASNPFLRASYVRGVVA